MSEKTAAVLFDPADYAGLPKRLASWIIDLAVMIAILIGLGVIVEMKYVPADVIKMPPGPQRQREITKYFKPYQVPVLAAWFGSFAIYHILLRRSRGGTLGYRIMQLRLVDAQGDPPSWPALVRRFLIAVPTAGLLGATYLPCR